MSETQIQMQIYRKLPIQTAIRMTIQRGKEGGEGQHKEEVDEESEGGEDDALSPLVTITNSNKM